MKLCNNCSINERYKTKGVCYKCYYAAYQARRKSRQKPYEKVADLDGEIWKDIENYEGYYQVSNFGRIKSLARYVNHYKGGVSLKNPKIKKQFLDIGGYCVSGMSKPNKYETRKIHVFVAKAFIPNPDNKPQVNHIDGVKHNNWVSNLEWVTRSENMSHAYNNNLLYPVYGSRNHMTPFSEQDVLFIIRSELSAKELSNKYNVRIETIYGIRRGQNWSHLTGINYEPKKRK